MRRAALLMLGGAVLSSCFAPRDGTVVAPAASAPAASAPPSSPARLDNPSVTVSAEPFPIVTAFALKAAPIGEGVTDLVRRGIDRYLDSLDRYRGLPHAERNPTMLPVRGRFAEVVAAAMDASATPGVTRAFRLGSLRVESLLVKPWGTFAVAEATVTIFDSAVEGGAADQVETGRLRLVGDRLSVADGWDGSNRRWFNGTTPAPPDRVRAGTPEAVGTLLRSESWLAGMAPETWYGPGSTTAFQRGRHAFLTSLDRTAIASRTFADVTATIERYDGFGEIDDGLAYVRVTASLLTTDASGRRTTEPFTRRVVVLFGQWMPEVVDEEITPGSWRSGGDLALAERDHVFA